MTFSLDTHDVPRNQFLVACKAWQLCRAGQADPGHFGIYSMQGLWYIVSQLVRDLAALNKAELLPWDCWALGDIEEGGIPSIEDAALLDRIATLTLAGNEAFPGLHSIYENEARLRVPPVIKSYHDAGVREINMAGE